VNYDLVGVCLICDAVTVATNLRRSQFQREPIGLPRVDCELKAPLFGVIRS
jgi:hypothetical protein